MENRLKRDIEKLKALVSNEIILNLKDDDIYHLHVQITGPKDSPFEEGVFKLDVIIPNTFPMSPPAVRFVTKIYHPNIDDNGRICLQLLQLGKENSWTPVVTLIQLFNSIRMLLLLPNVEDPLMPEIAKEYLESPETYFKKAKELTKKYAC